MVPVLLKNICGPNQRDRFKRKAASTNTTASIHLNVVKDYKLKEDGLHIFQPHSKMSKKKLSQI